MHVIRAVALLLVSAGSLAAQGEAYYFATGGLAAGDDSYVDTWCGPDMLPYTDDDIDLPANGNAGGTWGFSWIDADGDGDVGDEEHIFTVIRRGDDDMHTLSTKTYLQYGVIAEGEDWIDYHEARNQGPSATVPGEEGNDFEHNDAAGRGETGWENATNYYAYNNHEPDQRSRGRSKYFFSHRNGEGLDEIEGFNKWLTFSNNLDDPTTPGLDERGPCRNSYMRSLDAVIQGLLIPVDDVADLEDGSIDPLFGWYDGDMALYIRDTLGPKLEDGSLTVFKGTGGCATSGLPPTHLMILQIECPIQINAYGDCGDGQSVAESQAAYWGIHPVAPGEPETDAVYRACHILLFNDELTAVDLGVPLLELEPDDGVARNLWIQDDFWRSSSENIGRYALGGAWSIQPDMSFDHGCSETDMRFELPTPPGYFDAPLSAALDPAAGAVLAVVEIADTEPATQDKPPLSFQVAFLDGDSVVAYADLSSESSAVHTGGSLDDNGLAEDPDTTQEGSEADVPRIGSPGEATEFTRFVLRVGPGSIRLSEAPPGEYLANNYENLDAYEVLASASAGVSGNVTSVRVAVSGEPGGSGAVVDGFAVFSNLEPDEVSAELLRGDTNNDGKADISDGIFLLNHLFLGGPRWVCEESADINGDDKQDLSDAVFLFSHLFLGGAAPPPPFPDCGPDPGGAVCPLSICAQ